MTGTPGSAVGRRRAACGREATAAFRLIADGPAAGAWNMAMDEALLHAARRGRFTLRLYAWSPGCLSFGRHQAAVGHYDAARAARLGIDVVRRPTGGRAVYHGSEVTYAVTAPAEAWGGLRESYRRINRALARGLRELGAPAELAGASPRGVLPGPLAGACFRDPLPGEVTAGGRKVVGSAQWREAGALLQHGSLLLRDEQWVAERLRTGARADEAPPAAAGLADLLGREASPEEVRGALAAGFADEFEAEVAAGEATAAERGAARRLEARYRSPGWTWRR